MHPGPLEQIGNPYEIGNVAEHAAPTCGSANNVLDATKVTSPNTLTSIAVRDVQFCLSFTPGDPMPDDAVQTSGRTTGYQTGEINAINVSYNVPANGGYCCGALTMKQQIEWLSNEPTQGGDSGSGLLSTEAPPRGHRFRNQVLRRSDLGQQFVGYFCQFSDEAIAIAGRSPGLLLRSGQALATIAPLVLARLEQGEVTVPAVQLQLVDDTLAAYADGASAELQAAIRDTRAGLRSPRVLSALGIKVEGAWSLTR
jgi:hypothetical protein